MPLHINIPIRTHEEFGDSINKLLHLVLNLRRANDRQVILDFTKSRMLNPFYLGGLTCMIDYYRSKGYELLLNHDDNKAISSYLRIIGFPSGYDIDRFIGNKSYLDGRTYVPLIKIPTGESQYHTNIRERVGSSITNLLQSQLRLTAAQYGPIVYLIDEFTNNINDHSGAGEGIIFGQFYPNSNYFDLCICDHGKGIFGSYSENERFKPSTELEALEFAINGKSTKDRPEARGFGISTSRDMLVNGLRGKFFIWSGNNAYIQSVGSMGILNIPENCYFNGTYIALRVPTVIPRDFDFYKYIDR